jgi:hypothetical protein
MDYKEHMIIEKWKDVSTEEIVETKKECKRILFYSNENYMFILFFLIFMSPSIVCFLFGAPTFAKLILFPSFVGHFFFWFFYLKKAFNYTEEIRESALITKEKCDIVLKSRKLDKTKNPD